MQPRVLVWAGGNDVFVAKLAPGGSSQSIAHTSAAPRDEPRFRPSPVDSLGSVYLTGLHHLREIFPVRGALQTQAWPAIATSLHNPSSIPAGNALGRQLPIAASVSLPDTAYGIAIQTRRAPAYIAGRIPPRFSFPRYRLPARCTRGGQDCLRPPKLSADGSAWFYSTYPGGFERVTTRAAHRRTIRRAPSWIAGATTSGSADYSPVAQRYAARQCPRTRTPIVTRLKRRRSTALLFRAILLGRHAGGSVMYPGDRPARVALDSQRLRLRCFLIWVSRVSVDFPGRPPHSRPAGGGPIDAFGRLILTVRVSPSIAPYLGGSSVDGAKRPSP
jgi:hypothetical protein